MTRKLLAANWKMNLTYAEALTLAEDLIHETSLDRDRVRPSILAVPQPYLAPVLHVISGSADYELAAQDIHQDARGAFTGDVSAEMVKSCGATWTLLGHSERRQYHQETDELLGAKVRRALEHHLNVVFCVGETLAEREAGQVNSIIERQLKKGLFFLKPEDWVSLVIAYEPVWAIGTGKTATPEQAQEVHAHIRQLIGSHFDADIANGVSLLYGGSVKPANANQLFAQPDLDGALVGGASLNANDFLAILTSLEAA